MGAVAFGLPEFKVNKTLESTDGRSLRYEVEVRDKPTKCPNCGASGQLRVHGSKHRDIRDSKITQKLVFLGIKFKRYKCLACGKTFLETVESVDDSMFTKRLREEIVGRVLTRETFTKILYSADSVLRETTPTRVKEEIRLIRRLLLEVSKEL